MLLNDVKVSHNKKEPCADKKWTFFKQMIQRRHSHTIWRRIKARVRRMVKDKKLKALFSYNNLWTKKSFAFVAKASKKKKYIKNLVTSLYIAFQCGKIQSNLGIQSWSIVTYLTNEFVVFLLGSLFHISLAWLWVLVLFMVFISELYKSRVAGLCLA